MDGDAGLNGSDKEKAPLGHFEGKGIFQNDHELSQDVRLLKRALRQNWPISRHKRRRIIARLYEMVDSNEMDAETAIAAANALKGLDGINARREAAAMVGSGNQGTQVNVAVGVRVVQRDDFYGNDAHDRDAETIDASTNGHAIPGEIQDTGLRPTVGENGNGHDERRNGTRPEAGDAQGGA